MDLKESIQRVLREEVDDKKSKLLNLVKSNGLFVTSRLVGGYDNLQNILRGTEYLNRDVMMNTIKDYFTQPNRLQYLDLNEDLGLEHITLEKGNDYLITLSGLFKKGFEVIIYKKDADGDLEEIDERTISFEDDDDRQEPLLKTIHLYEIVDAIMERWSIEQDYVNESVKRIVKEDDSKQTKLKNKIDTIGIGNVIKLIGLDNIVKILDLDLNDVDTQLMLVKNFIYHTTLRDIEVSFLEVKNSASGGKIIKVYFTTQSNAGNIESFYGRVLCDELEELFPFRVVPSWEPVFATRNVKIFINTEKIKDDEESELNEKWSEKYKKSINCNNPKGFSQKAHCAGRKKEMKEEELTEKCWKGYTQKGMKTMFGKRYPNCVKKTKKR